MAEDWIAVRRQKEAKSLFVQGLPECYICIGAMMLSASVEEQNKQEENAPLLSWRKGKLRKNVESYCLRECEVTWARKA